MVSVTGVEWAYTEAPPSMKAWVSPNNNVNLKFTFYKESESDFDFWLRNTLFKAIMNACWVLTTCIGNLIDLVIVSLKFTREQSNEYFIFAGLMTGAAISFLLLAIFYYEYVPEGAYDNLDDEETKLDEKASHSDGNEEKEAEAEL